MDKRKSKIINEHRMHLIARSLTRNPLLSFKPTTQGRGRIDVCTLFEESPDEKQEGATDFFRELIEQGKARLQLRDNPAMEKRLHNMRREASLLNRTTGEHSLFFGWPFITIPRDGRAPLSTALFFWDIDIKPKTENQEFVFSHAEDSIPRYNYILDAWLQGQYNRGLLHIAQEQSDVEDAADKDMLLVAIRERIDKFCKQWKECNNQLTSTKDLYELHTLSGHDSLNVSPHAVIGTANFKYMTLLSDLKKLENKVDNNEQRTLLDEVLENGSSEISNPIENNEDCELKKYLVEASDASQEKVVWQTRKSKITFLDGPPGTGKSQTIVNLIADSLQRNEKVMLVCHQQAALNVVKKRLDANLDGLSLLITDARTQRMPVIQGIVNISENGDTHGMGGGEERDTHSVSIETLENKCNQITASLSMGKTENYSMRGHLRGRMESIKQQTHFSPFDLRVEKFINHISFYAEKLLDDKNNQKDNMNKLKHFAECYDKCYYDKNKWKDAHLASLDANKVSMQFKELVKEAKELDGMSQELPNKKLLPLLFSDIMLKYAKQFFSEEKRNAVSTLSDLTKHTKRIFALSEMHSVPIWEEVYAGNGGDIYMQYATDAAYLDIVASINEMIRENSIIATFMQYQKNIKVPMAGWKDVLESILCYQECQKHPEEGGIIGMRAQYYEKLKEELQAKEIADAKHILGMYPRRRDAAVNLQSRRLLKIKGSLRNKATTIRDIYHEGREDVCMIYPALLTTPDTMSQILPLEPGVVDLVIIDEASQMFVADALPVLYRAKKIVISGDKMQMPPDDSFVSDDEIDDDSDVDVASEAGQEVTGAAGLSYELMEVMENVIPPTSNARCKLSVHYRSRPEELIAFSNYAFYEGRLQAAPDNTVATPPLKRPIKMEYVAGIFENSVNEQEANKIIELLEMIWCEENPPSVGVIVFNVKQAKYLEERIREKAENSETFGKFYGRAREQNDNNGEFVGFFVRSVTHVQGDERDIIILGTTYDDKVNNYGPLSQTEKGRRRLNVAVTRAKLGMYVVTSLNIKEIGNESMRPTADVKGQERWFLWKFMEYAKFVSNGEQKEATKILQSFNNKYKTRQTERNPDSQFEIDVGEFIDKLGGYQVVYQVGEGGFRIDIGVKKKGVSGRYLCGIECDGRYWHEGWRARHRDVSRQKILEEKGWNIYRIWSDHWYGLRSEEANLNLRKHLEERVKDMAI